jgi:hexulose-6-phosphate isomerase
MFLVELLKIKLKLLFGSFLHFVPFVDASRIESEADVDCVVAVLQSILPVADETGIEIHLETSLSPTHFAELLAKIPHPKIKVNYDSGNSSSLGYRPVDEFAAYGERIGSVHIKDRIYGGGTVRLGTGDADLRGLAHCLKSVGYAGEYILQVARNSAGDEVAWARQNRAFLVDLLANAGLNVGDIA